MGNNNGIIDPGTEITKKCECGKEFKTHINVVTIKGPGYPETKCGECREKAFNKAIANMKPLK